jgi:hypothetical protein
MGSLASEKLAVVASLGSARPCTQASEGLVFGLRVGHRDCVRGGLTSLSLLIFSEAVLPDIL